MAKEKARQVLAMRQGSFRYVSDDPNTGRKREKLVQFEDLPNLGWIIGTTVFADDYEKSLIQFRRIMTASTLLTLLLAALLAIVMGGYVTRPLTRLMARIQGGDGATGAEDWNTGDEVRAMARRYAEIMDNVRHYSADLEAEVKVREKAESELQIYREMFLNAIEGITVTDADARIIAVNPAFTQITGYSFDEAVGRNPSLLRSAHHDEALLQADVGPADQARAHGAARSGTDTRTDRSARSGWGSARSATRRARRPTISVSSATLPKPRSRRSASASWPITTH